MVIDFSKIDIKEKPLLILKNLSGTPVGVLGAATNITADIKYNEVSVLEFTLPAYVDNIKVANYDEITGMKIIDFQNIGQFIIVNPEETGDGVQLAKKCKAYSLEYEFTFKKITLESGTYNFWNPVAPGGTILDIILELMPSWKIGVVDSALVGKYRTYEVAEENLYNFIKNTLQQSYNCIFDFDTYNRVINVKDVSSAVAVNPVFISSDNLAKEIKVEEDTENVITRLDVNGAEGVDIRDVNPTGTNKLINLDHYMTTGNFEQSTIDKYFAWKDLCQSYRLQYYNYSIEYSLQTMRKVTETAALTDLEGELTSLENQQAVIIRAIAQDLKDQTALDEINAQIAEKQSEISTKKTVIESITNALADIMAELVTINKATDFQSCFTADEYIIIDRFIKDDSVSESSFVVQATNSYSDSDYGNKVTSQVLRIVDSDITITVSATGNMIYEIVGGSAAFGDIVDANLIRGVFERVSDGTVVMTAYFGKGTLNGDEFVTGCMSLSGSCGDVGADATSLVARGIDAFLYFTLDTSEYAKRAVAWDLFEYGNEILTRISQPAYKFSVSSANFLFIDEFIGFKNAIRQGEKIYIGLPGNKVLTPIAIGMKLDYNSYQNLSLEFSDTYISGDSSFHLADLLDKSVSMGKSVDLNKYTYSSFIDSGASTQVKDFMISALDVSKNAIMSSKNQAISWGDSGIRLREWADDEHTIYDPRQLWLSNNCILMTSNNWTTAELAIGNFYDPNLGSCWGIVAPNIVGTLLAGSNLVIESVKKDGEVAVFKVDADGCVLHNSTISVTSDVTRSHILLDAVHGIAVGKYPLIDSDGKIIEDNYKFWVDETGNLFFKGTLYAADGEFTGKITATSGYIGGSEGWTIESIYIYNGRPSFSSNAAGIYIGTNGISLGDGTNYIRARQDGYFEANNVSIRGSVVATDGYIGGCSIANGLLQVPAAQIRDKLTATQIDANGITAIGVNVTGTIVATAGVIGGCTIANGLLQVPAANISGQLTASQINANGITAINVFLSGTIVATAGTIGGCTISNGLLQVPAANISGRLTASQINADGITATNVTLSGTITALSGTIGNAAYNWTIGSSGSSASIYCGTSSLAGTGGLGVDSNNMYIGTNGISMKADTSSSYDYTTVVRSSIVMVYGDPNGGGSSNRCVSMQPFGVRFFRTGSSKVGNVSSLSSYQIAALELGPADNFVSMTGNWQLASAAATTSDRNKKNTIENVDARYDNLFDHLTPRRFKYNDGQSGRYHTGFIAQEVYDAMTAAGLSDMEFAAICYNNLGEECESWGIRYEEMLALCVMKIQNLNAELAELKEKISL